MASLVASDAIIYSASIAESATVLCLELFQLTARPFNRNNILIAILDYLGQFGNLHLCNQSHRTHPPNHHIPRINPLFFLSTSGYS
ncbi:hypothetical protein QN277_019777 [Acacia crassicarpa]|uniref:Uncharacterized protein n=1 Tax=Acacia crassicarpa TaxID=499986 RepID=A0AAE1JLH9_9FABA|nr:hypothetical protein QN277_019777 [Acacia crassicarpa]